MNKSANPQKNASSPKASGTPLIQAKALRKSYRMGRVTLEVLKGVDLTVQPGEFVAIYGHSGSGKSTLLHLVGLLDKQDQGTIFLDGEDAAAMHGRRRNRIRSREIGFVFQFYHLLPELNVLENTMIPAMIGDGTADWWSNRKSRRARARMILDELGLSDRLRHKPKELSGGERQRVAIARALINQPKLLLADEPTGNLDSKTGGKIMDLLLRYHQEHNQTIVMVTHDNDLARQVQRTVMLEDGRLRT
jgi:lipoprotein-releasing system ATP-binding protein